MAVGVGSDKMVDKFCGTEEKVRIGFSLPKSIVLEVRRRAAEAYPPMRPCQVAEDLLLLALAWTNSEGHHDRLR